MQEEHAHQELKSGGGGKWKWITLVLATYFIVDKTVFTASEVDAVNCDDHGGALSPPLSIASSAWWAASTSDVVVFSDIDVDASLPREPPPPRSLASSGSASSGSSSGSSGSSGDANHHQYEALYYLMFEMFVGSMVIFVSMFPAFQSLQSTVALFLLGLTFSLFHKIDGFTEFIGPLGRSYDMWMEIDPHLLLFTLLPPLLAGDAMSIDTHVVKMVGKQCLFLAGPGVGINATIAAGFLRLYLGIICGYSWNFTLCMVAGAILCATDPVAVVSLLKELGAPPRLTVQIQGESLLNDGTAIVLYLVFYRSLEGYQWDLGEVVEFLIKTALYAFLLGLLVGTGFFMWIKAANNKFDHSSITIQVSLTLAAAYGSFLISEGVFHISGVLATVASSLILAHKMWPEVVDHETMTTIWHMFENLGNIIIFFLAGCLVGEALDGIPFMDYVHLIVIYLVLLVIRGGMIFAFRPLLTRLGGKTGKHRPPVTVADAAVMTWGGLRGAVGLALAIQVAVERAKDQIPELEAKRVLFYVGGVALLTLVVNATTCPWLVKKLGVTQMPESKRKVLRKIKGKLEEIVDDIVQPAAAAQVDHPIDVIHSVGHGGGANNHTEHEDATSFFHHTGRNTIIFEQSQVAVKNDLYLMLEIMEEHLNEHHDHEESAEKRGSSAADLSLKGNDTRATAFTRSAKKHESEVETIENYKRCCSQLKELEVPPYFMDALVSTHGHGHDENQAHEHKPREHQPHDEHQHVQEEMNELIDFFRSGPIDFDWQRTINESFLNLVNAHYWHMMHNGLLTSGEADVLIGSVLKALSSSFDLNDFKYLNEEWGMEVEPTPSSTDVRLKSMAVKQEDQSPLEAFITGPAFMVTIMSCIVLNSIVSMVDGELETESESRDQIMLALELFFTLVFTVECLLKIIVERAAYFKDAWNLFDFVLVILGWVGIFFMVMQLVTGEKSDVSASGGMARAIKILKILRAVRMVRLARILNSLGAKLRNKYYSFDVGRSLTKLALLESFIKAHKRSQEELLTFFGKNDKPASPEVARCIMQSQVGVLHSVALSWSETHEGEAKPAHLQTVKDMLAKIHIVEDLVHFVMSAKDVGCIDIGEAESITHVMHTTAAAAFTKLWEMRSGWLDKADVDAMEVPSPGFDERCKSFHAGQVGANKEGNYMPLEETQAVETPPNSELNMHLSTVKEEPDDYGASDASVAPSFSSEPAPEPLQILEAEMNKKKKKSKVVKIDEQTSEVDGTSSVKKAKSKKAGDAKGSKSNNASKSANASAKVPKKKSPSPVPEKIGAKEEELE